MELTYESPYVDAKDNQRLIATPEHHGFYGAEEFAGEAESGEGHYFRDAIRLRRSRVAENLSGE